MTRNSVVSVILSLILLSPLVARAGGLGKATDSVSGKGKVKSGSLIKREALKTGGIRYGKRDTEWH